MLNRPRFSWESIESLVVWSWLILFGVAVAALAVNVPYYDEWFHLRWAVRILDGGPVGAGPFEWVNGSRLVLFRSLLLVALRGFGAYSPLPFMAASAICSACSAWACVALLRRALPPSPVRALASFAIVSLIASLAQHEVLFWGLELSLVVPGTLLILGLIVLPRASPVLRVRVAFALSLFGLASFATGVALFAALAFASLRAGVSRRAAMGYAALTVFFLLAWHMDLSAASSGENVAAAHPALAERVWRIPAHFLAALGSGADASVLWPVARKGGALLTPLVDAAAVLAGLAPLIVFGIELRRRRALETAQTSLTDAAWTLFAFGGFAAALIALGRHDQGISQALSSRYVTLTVFALVGVAFILARDGRLWALTLLAAAALANAGAGLVVANAWRQARVEGAASLPFARELPELPGFEALTPDFPHEVAADLMRRRMIAPALAPTGVRAAIEYAAPTVSPPPCRMTPPGALTPSYQKPTPLLAAFDIQTARAGALVVVGRSLAGIRALSAAHVRSAGTHTAHTTLKGAPSGAIDLEAWLLTGDSLDSLFRAGACRTDVPRDAS